MESITLEINENSSYTIYDIIDFSNVYDVVILSTVYGDLIVRKEKV